MHDILSPEGSCKRSGIFMNLSWRQVTNHPLGAPVAIEGFPTSSSSLVGFLKLSGFTKLGALGFMLALWIHNDGFISSFISLA